MPNANVLALKQKQVDELKEKIAKTLTGVIVSYQGTTVADDTTLRKELRENNVEYFVIKNTILSRAIDGTDLADIKSVLEGSTAIALCYDDYVAPARILGKFADAHDNFNIKAGFMDGKVMPMEQIDALAKLPSREVLLATVCNAFQAPIAAFARAIQAVVDKSGTASNEATAEESAE